MNDLVRSRATLVWAGLFLATLLTWWLGTDHGLTGATGRRIATGIVLVVAFAKIRFVGLDFMELRSAPRWLRTVFEGWVALFATATVVLSVI
ncbi:cytochrome C oxidase subunit IV family protein [Pseudonocardia spinosispora]|uniref:cytochrome C oxidase subunit IV family protein n=1 Tax=Pseudonocardia spinosispora TaxID=103441 RepID=UPI0003FE1DDA|nr:cytochrome C oxidase subunit IV family protein [Pseudonocardia spinosispora]